jgi:peptidoglycan LD-endopeptidase LytH
MNTALISILSAHQGDFAPVSPFDFTKNPPVIFDFTEENKELASVNLSSKEEFCGYITRKISQASAQGGIGKYREERTIYRRSPLFNNSREFRSIHLGIDIWAPAGTPVFAPLEGTVHSLQNNSTNGDYGPTLVLRHELEGQVFHTLYGHLNLNCLNTWAVGMEVAKGTEIATYGPYETNVHWPPHLHFQIIEDMEGKHGDYPGVCTKETAAFYLKNCPDPNLILNIPDL